MPELYDLNLEQVEIIPCPSAPAGTSCITGMLYSGCMDESCWNESCTYEGVCPDPRHSNNKKDEK